jgi:hypothetical protein
VRFHIELMAKYSDLFGCERSPANYLAQLRRCSGLIPLNVLATINNRLVIGEPAHGSWEHEFLNENTRNRMLRFRSRVTEECVVFTRAGSLLNLKLLLALQPSSVPFRSTAIGAIATHSNDYGESVDTQHLSSGVLSVITEFAPTWELFNIRELLPLLARSFHLYRLAQDDERMTALFRKPLEDVPLGGLTFRMYFALLFGIYSSVRKNVVAAPFPTSILNAVEIATMAGLTVDQFNTFASAKAMTFDEARSCVGWSATDNTFKQNVTSSRWASSPLAFRARPVLKLDDGRFLVLDLQFLFESASAGLSWSLMQELGTPHERLRFLDTWGDLFERYVRDLLTHYYPDQEVARTYPPDGQIDAILSIGEDVVVVEVKSGFIAEAAKGSRDMRTIDEALRNKYVTDKKGKKDRGVGVRQLVATTKALLSGKVSGVTATGRIIPVLVGEDPILRTPGMNTYLNDFFSEEIASDRVAPLTVVLIDELEDVLPQIRAGDFTWLDLVTSRFEGERMVAAPVSMTLADLAASRGFSWKPDTFLKAQSDALMAMVEDAYLRNY